MKRGFLNTCIALGFCFVLTSSPNAETITKPHTFTAGSTARSADVNANFDTVYDQVNKMGGSITVDPATGNVGIGTTAPARKLHITDAVRLEPSASAPASPDSGDLYYDITDALCLYMAAGWSKLAGTGSCGSVTTTVVSAAGQIWMDRNLGASQVSTSSTDSAAYGDLYQWGRNTDGHEKRASGTTSTNSSTDVPGHGNFILEDISPYDWRDPQNDNLWQGVSGVNNPCPVGFILPTEAEWQTEISSWASNDAAGAYASPLKLVMAGTRPHYNGTVSSEGSSGYYWSSTAVGGGGARQLTFNGGNADMVIDARARGLSVRCLKDGTL